jgi:hypothetical protein
VATFPSRPLRIYADTSVFGGCFDPPFLEGSRRFFRFVRRRRILVLLSEIVETELENAPPPVQRIIRSLPGRARIKVEITEEVLALRRAYLTAGIVPPRSAEDADHVAAATVAKADAIVSWNFRDIVEPGRIRGYNRINLRLGYDSLTIQTPREVLDDEE